jgi:type I restriction enzyme S subunit
MNHKIGMPQLRFPSFDGNWKIDKLNKFATLNPKNSILPESFVYIDLESVTDGFLTKENTIFKAGAPSRAQRILKDKDILYQTVRPYQKNNLYFNKIGDYVASTGYAQIRTKNDSQFLFQFLHTEKFVANVMLRCTGTSYPAINSSDLSSIEVSFPTLPEQQKIASFLSAVDEKIQQLSRKKELLDQYKKGLTQQLFSAKLRFKDENGKDYADWEEKKLGSLTFKVGKKNKENIKYPIYSINNKEGFLPQSEQFDGLDSNDRGYDISLYKIVNSETFAYNPARINVGSIGYSHNLDEVIVSSLYVCFKTKDSLEDLFLLAYLETYTFKKDILRFEEGGVRQYLFYENFSMISIPLPSNKEQKRITNFLSSIDAKIESTIQQINQTQSFKKGLLQQMFV